MQKLYFFFARMNVDINLMRIDGDKNAANRVFSWWGNIEVAFQKRIGKFEIFYPAMIYKEVNATAIIAEELVIGDQASDFNVISFIVGYKWNHVLSNLMVFQLGETLVCIFNWRAIKNLLVFRKQFEVDICIIKTKSSE